MVHRVNGVPLYGVSVCVQMIDEIRSRQSEKSQAHNTNQEHAHAQSDPSEKTTAKSFQFLFRFSLFSTFRFAIDREMRIAFN